MEVFAANLGRQGCNCIDHSAPSRLALVAACENEIGGPDDRSSSS